MLNAAIPFFLIPILTKNLLPADYGTMAMFLVLVGLLSPFVGANIHGAVVRTYYDSDKYNFKKYVFNCLLILAFSAVISGILLNVASDVVHKYSGFPKSWLNAVIIYSFFQFTGLLLLSIWQAKNKAIKYGSFVVFRTIFDLGISIFLVVCLSYGWEGRVIGQLVAISATGIFVVVVLLKSNMLQPKFDWNYIKDALRFGIPLIPHALGVILFTMTDRIFITNMLGLKATGIYFVAYQVGMVIYIFSDAFNKAWVPWFYEKLKTNLFKDKIKIIKITYLYFIAICILSYLLFLVTPFIFDLFIGRAYSEASDYVIWFIIGFTFNGMYKIVCNYIFYERRTKIIGSITFIAGVLNIILNFLLIPIHGLAGAAQASAFCFFLSFMLTWISSAKIYKMPWNLFTYKQKHNNDI